MKAARVVVFSAAAVAVILLIAAAVAFNSSFQTWAARRALATRSDLHATLGSLSAGFQRVEIRALQMNSDGAILTLPSLQAELPLVSAGWSQRVLVKSLVAKGWTLDLTKAKNLAPPATSPSAPRKTAGSAGPAPDFSVISTAQAADAATKAVAAPLFRGLFAGLQLPVELSLDGVELEGEVILPDTLGHGVERLRLTLRGGGLAAGHDGSFVIDLAGAKPDGGALTLHGTLTATMDTPRSFTRLGAKVDAAASGPQFPEGVALKIDSTAERKPAGESYVLLLADGKKQLADIKAELVTAASRISGTWKLDVHDSDLAPFALGRKLPTFTATGQGGFETGTALEEIHASGRLVASADRLEVVRPELSAVGLVNLTADFDVLQHGDSLRVERLDATVSGATPVGTVRALQSFEFNLGTGELRVADPAQDLVGLSLTGLPMGWARPFTGDFEATGGDVRGEFAASARDGGLSLRARTPLIATGVNLARSGKPLLRDIDLTLNASADYTPRGWQAQVVELTLRAKGATLFSLNAKAGRLTGKDQGIKATGRWSADLPGWTLQPVVAGQLQLSAGLAQGDFNASLDGTNAFEAKVALSNLIAVSKETLPAINVEVRADVASDGKTTFNAPVLFEQAGHRSDLLFAGTFTPGSAVSMIDARLSSEHLVVDDLKALAALIPAEKPSAGPVSKEPDTVPFWNGLQGQATLALKKVVYGGSYEVSDVGGVVRIEPTGLNLDGVRAVFGPESDLKLSGGVKFDPKAKEGYTLAGEMALNNFDTAPAFRAVDAAKLPTVETRMNLTGHIGGTGENIATLAERAHGRFDVTSKGGIFRALATVLPAEKIQNSQTALSVVGGLFGGSTTGETITALNEIVKLVSEIQFDQLSVTAERDANLNLVLKDFNLIAPYIRLGGEGLITYDPGKPLLQQALDAKITLGARGKLGELLGQYKLLKAEKDSLGYTAFAAPIKIGGTVGNTDTSDFKAKLLSMALEKSGMSEALLRLIGK